MRRGWWPLLRRTGPAGSGVVEVQLTAAGWSAVESPVRWNEAALREDAMLVMGIFHTPWHDRVSSFPVIALDSGLPEASITRIEKKLA